MKINPYMYIFLNQSLGMSTGKVAAQAAHAAIEAYKISKPEMIEAWEKGGKYAKVTLLAEDSEAMQTYERYIHDRGFRTVQIIDEGRTEIAPLSRTALGVEIVDKNDEHTALTFGEFQVYKERGYHVYTTHDIPVADAVNALRIQSPDYLSRKGKKSGWNCI